MPHADGHEPPAEDSPPGYAARFAALRASLVPLPDKPDETVASTLAALWCLAADRPLSASSAREAVLPPLNQTALRHLDDLIERRLRGEPLAHLTGWERFYGLELMTSAGALVPRRETELLARVGIEATQETLRTRGAAIVADACTGCGNVALAIASTTPQARVFGADLSASSVELAESNARQLGLSDRVTFSVGDLLTPFEELAGSIDVLVCNPPYISSAKVGDMAAEISEHEPNLAFDGGPFGVSLLMRLIAEAPPLLADGAVIAFEVGAGQGPSTVRRLERNDRFVDAAGIADDEGVVRVVRARLAGK